MLGNRLRNRQRHLRKWARRRGITCYRLYERDIPDYPAIVDWYDGAAVAWFYERRKDESEGEAAAHLAHCIEEVLDGLEIERHQLFIKERRRQRGLSQYERVATEGAARIIEEHGLRFEVNLSDYLDTGLFLDHRTTRTMVEELATNTRFLNLFAYTGTFSCYARRGGATRTCTVDLSNRYCAWAERNQSLNGYALDADHEIVRADVLHWLTDAATADRQFDLIVCDPPTFSNSKKMDADSFAVDRDHPALIEQCARVLAPGGTMFFSTNSRKFALDDAALPESLSVREITNKTIPEDFRNDRIHRCWTMRKDD